MSAAARIAALAWRCGRLLPPRRALWLGGVLGHAYAHLGGRDNRRAREHLAIAFPEHDRAWVERTARRCFRHFGRMVLWTLATLHVPPARLRRVVGVTGLDVLREVARAARRGQGAVAISAHLGNWEVLARITGTLMPVTVVGRRLDDPGLNALVERLRCEAGNACIYQDQGLTPCVRAVRGGAVLALLADQDVPRLQGAFVPWFGRLAHTPIGPAAIHLLTRQPVMIGLSYFSGRRWVLHWGPVRPCRPSGDRNADLLDLTAWATAEVEALVRRHPEQWPWWHKRWRTRPEDRPEAPVAGARQREPRDIPSSTAPSPSSPSAP